MSPERFERVRDLFLLLRELPGEERDNLLRAECKDDPELLTLVDRMLSTDRDAAPSPLDEPLVHAARVLASVDAQDGAAPVPDRIDKYRVVRLLGSGSVGDVYLAEQQEPIARMVALKLLRSVGAGSRSASRFAIEREALSKLSHPNIAGILDAGRAPGGRAYIVMELVDGMRLDEHIRTHQPTVQERLLLFVQLCAGVQHAHHRGVIHRDLKPANVLVVHEPGAASVKIVDFGIAKLLDSDRFFERTLTANGQLLGTLSYMSPEQLDPSLGPVDARCDVYALGVMLYQLVSGRMPYGDTDSGLIHAIKTADRVSPRPLPEAPKGMRRDIETIVERAMEHDPDRRYPSPAHLADDVRRVLAGEPILARRASLAARVAMLARRNPRIASALVACLVVIVSLSVLNTIAVVRLDRQVSKERDAVATMLDESLERVRRLSGAIDSRRAMAESLLAQTERLLASRPRDATLLESKARILDELSDLAMAERDRELCLDLRGQVVDLYTQLRASSPDDIDLARRHAEALVKIGDLLGSTRHPRGSEPLYTQALAIHEQLVARHPDHAGALDDLCWSYERMSTMYWWLDDRPNALRYAMSSVAASERLVSLSPDRSLSHHAARGANLHLFNLLIGDDESERARATLDKALHHAQVAATLEPDRLDFLHARAIVRDRVADHALAAGRFEEAEEHTRMMISDADRLARDNPVRADLLWLPVMSRVRLASVMLAACRPADAHAAARLAIRYAYALDTSDAIVSMGRLDLVVCDLLDMLDRTAVMLRTSSPQEPVTSGPRSSAEQDSRRAPATAQTERPLYDMGL